MTRSPDNLDLFGPSPSTAAPVAAAVDSAGEGKPPRVGANLAEPARPIAELLEVVNRSGSGFRELVVTHNRRVVLSVGGRGATLRMHRAFLSASEPVLEAVGRLFTSRRTRERKRARADVRAFLAGVRSESPRRARRRAVSPPDLPHLARLREEFERVNREHFDGELPTIPIFLSGAMRRRNGHFSSDPLEIVISRRLCTHAVDGEAARTLRHEIIHLWQHVQGRRPGHGADFREWARLLDVHPRATRAVCWLAGVEARPA